MSQEMSFEISWVFKGFWTLQASKESFSPAWVRRWVLGFPEWLKDFGHCKRLKGFLSSMSQEMNFEISWIFKGFWTLQVSKKIRKILDIAGIQKFLWKRDFVEAWLWSIPVDSVLGCIDPCFEPRERQRYWPPSWKDPPSSKQTGSSSSFVGWKVLKQIDNFYCQLIGGFKWCSCNFLNGF